MTFRITIIGFFTDSYTLTEPSTFEWAIPNSRGAEEFEAYQDAEDLAVDFPLERQQPFTFNGGASFWLTFDLERLPRIMM
mmetsp:Transcript_18756/g.29810  ORF Transcript_18756/g.29810 Transcript_18756/m.29810 type:complete len:80 (+) Transcript_18756:276-515(+)